MQLTNNNSLKQITPLNWQHQLKNTINNISQLCDILNLDINDLELNLAPTFPLRVPYEYISKIEKSNPRDPLLLQVLPSAHELIRTPSFCNDPLDEKKYTKTPGLIHKYHSRVLLTLTSACGIHCRYCFRQHFPYSENIVNSKQRHQQLEYIQNNKNINEIILSGGDPLCVSDKYLAGLLEQIVQIEHIQTIRFHTRMPIVIPERICTEFISMLKQFQQLNFVLVTHCNHANELDDKIKAKMALLQQQNITLLNQAVLLNNINNNAQSLVDLSYKLFDCHIIPYYLHMLDAVQGASHFNVRLNQAKTLMSEIKTKLPGYLVPKLVQELPGELSKITLL